MIELTDHHFRDLCADDAVRRLINDADRNGPGTAKGFWAILILGLAIIGAATFIAIDLGHLVTGVLVGSIGVILVYSIAMVPLVYAGRKLKLEVLDSLARRNGLEYSALVHAPPVYAEAKAALFGETLSAEVFTDLFQGEDRQGGFFATCQAYLLGDDNSKYSGSIFSFARQRSEGWVVLVSDGRGPGAGQSVTFGEDPAFEQAFQVFAADAGEARALLGPEARRTLLDLRRQGRVSLYAGPGEILVAVEGRKDFTPGLGVRYRRGEVRVRAMFDDLADSLAMLRSLKAGLDGVL